VAWVKSQNSLYLLFPFSFIFALSKFIYSSMTIFFSVSLKRNVIRCCIDLFLPYGNEENDTSLACRSLRLVALENLTLTGIMAK